MFTCSREVHTHHALETSWSTVVSQRWVKTLLIDPGNWDGGIELGSKLSP